MNDELIYDVVLRLDPDSANKVAQQIEAIESVAGRLKSFDSEEQAAKKAEKAIQSKTDAVRQSGRVAKETAKVAQSAGSAEENAIKSVTQEIRAQIDAIDLAQRQRRISADDALAQYGAIEKRLASLDQTNQQVITRQRQLFFASERARNGFVTLSTSMVDVQNNTKGAAIALGNIGRIAQDLPFGIIGISNNIDPLLTSFRNLKTELGSTGLALRAILKLLGGPMGMLFLLGSILPSAIVIAQNGIQGFGKKSKEAMKEATDSVKEFVAQFAKAESDLAAQAAGKVSLEQVRVELQLAKDLLERLNKEERGYQEQLKGGRSTILESLLATVKVDKEIAQQSIASLEVQEKELNVQAQLKSLREQRALGESLTLQNRSAEQKKIDEERLERIVEEAKSLKEATAETQKRLDAERELSYIASLRAKSGDVSDMIDDSKAFDEFEVDFDPIAKTTKETYDRLELERIQSMRQSGDTASLIMQEQSIRLQNIDRNRLAMGLADEQAYQLARQNIIMDTEQKITQLQKAEIDNRRQMYMMGADFAIASASAVFGESKGIAVAQTIMDTWRGAQGVFAQTNGGLIARSLAAGVAVATGLANVRKILTTTKNTKSAGSSVAPSVTAPSTAPRTNFGIVDAQSIATSMGGNRINQSPTIVLTGDLDSEYLSIKVRRGNEAISSRGITVASV